MNYLIRIFSAHIVVLLMFMQVSFAQTNEVEKIMLDWADNLITADECVAKYDELEKSYSADRQFQGFRDTCRMVSEGHRQPANNRNQN